MKKAIKPNELTQAQRDSLSAGRIGFMNVCPFYAHLYYSIGREVLTRDVPTAATDGRNIFINPDYVAGLKTGEQIFVLAHEMDHLVKRHPQRARVYDKAGNLRGLPFNPIFANACMDYVINASLLESYGSRVQINPDWLYDPKIKGHELWEDIYEREYKRIQQKQQNQQGQQQDQQGNKTWRDTGNFPKTAQGDAKAKANGGSFDELSLDPPADPVTGEVDLPGPAEFKEAVARAYAVAKAQGEVPGDIKRLVEEILDPQIDWREHVRMTITGKIGTNAETWVRPNRRRLALHPIVVMPGKRGFGCETVAVAVDTSGSIGQKELDAFFAEIGGVLNDCKPRQIVVIGCDSRVVEENVERVSSLDDLGRLRQAGLGGGGGTRFEPVFDYIEQHDIKPETLIYLTDLWGSFPTQPPGYPVIWAATTDKNAPFGEVVRVKV